MPPFLQDATLPVLLLWVLGFFLVLTVAASAAGFLAERALPQRRMFDVPLFPGQYRFELLGNGIFLSVTSITVTLALFSGAVRFTSGWLAAVVTFAALLFGFQVFYYWLHRAMHHRSLLRFHRWHHRSQVTTPLTGQSVGPIEALGWMGGYVGLPLLMSWIHPISFVGWAAYLAFNVSGNVFGHSNVEPNVPAAASRSATLFANVFIYHALHHARWNGHYSFQTAMMDRLFGTEYADWPQLFARIIAGKPLKSLKERGDEPQAS